MNENYLDAALEACGPVAVEGPAVEGVLKYSGIVRQVLAGLRDKGVMVGSWAEVLKITLLVLDLIQELGPVVEEIVKRIQEILGK